MMQSLNRFLAFMKSCGSFRTHENRAALYQYSSAGFHDEQYFALNAAQQRYSEVATVAESDTNEE